MADVLPPRFWGKVQEDDRGHETPCWVWQAGDNGDGYGRFYFGGKKRYPHRVSFEAFVAEIPDGLQLDHLCRVHECVNPWHLEPVTNAVNTRRGRAGSVNAARLAAVTHCPKGHEYSLENTLYTLSSSGKRTHRQCRTCNRRRRSEWGKKNGR